MSHRHPIRTGPSRSRENWLADVREYYDRTTPLYLEYVGSTLQAGRLRSRDPPGDGYAPIEVSNAHFAAAAGIRPGDLVLDAGCGVCGPDLGAVNSCAT